MAVSPSRLNLARLVDFIPVQTFSGLQAMLKINKAAITASTELGLSADAAGFEVNNNTIAADIASFLPVVRASSSAAAGSGAEEVEMSTSGFTALKMNTAAMAVCHLMHIPHHWDLRHDIGVNVVWTSSAAAVGARSIDWTLTYRQLILDVSQITLTKVALDTAIAQDVPIGTSLIPQMTPQGKFAAGALQNSNTVNDFLALVLTLTAFDAAFTEDKFLLGLAFEYTPNFGYQRQYKRRGRNARRTTMLA